MQKIPLPWLQLYMIMHSRSPAAQPLTKAATQKQPKHLYTLPFREGVGVCQQQRNEIKKLVWWTNGEKNIKGTDVVYEGVLL